MPRSRRPPRWTTLPTSELLEQRICDLGLKLEGSPVEVRLEQLRYELARRGIRFRPYVWLSTDWFTPDFATGFAIPFFLVHPRLVRLERARMLEVEGGSADECMKLLRHETAHALDNAYNLRRRKRWRELFGSPSEPYRPSYNPDPTSRSHVLNLPYWYSQSHPLEDWAETFAVWLQPGWRWRARYADWPALEKLEYVDELVKEVAGRPAARRTRHREEPLPTVRMTLREYYARKQAVYLEEADPAIDGQLSRIFPPAVHGTRRPRAATFLRQYRKELVQRVAAATGQHRYLLDHVAREMIARSKLLDLRVTTRPTDAQVDAAVILTSLSTQFLYGGHPTVPAMKRLRVLALMHSALVPPDSLDGHTEEEVHKWKMEYDVHTALHNLGHEIEIVPVEDELKPIRTALTEFEPHIIFNLLMHFHDSGIYDSAIVSWLELKKQHYTGCNPRGLLVANDKALCKKVLSYHRIRHPHFMIVPRGRSVSRLPKDLHFPLFVKSSSEHASLGIAQASIVHDLEQLRERVEFIHRTVGTGAICEEYIEGRELTIGVLGNQRLETAPVWEVFMDTLPDGTANIFTSRVKWDIGYQKRIGLHTDPARNLPEGKAEEIDRIARRIYRALGLSGFARIDLRMDVEERVWVLEVNPNPDLCFGEDFAEAFERAGYEYNPLIQKILNLGLRYEAPWQG